jgi:CBS domain containing-hemolysin-like protein
MRAGAYFAPLVRFYQILLFPVAKPTALLLDHWLGKEQLVYFKENAFRIMLEKHIQSSNTDIGKLEGIGALNFLSIDDISISDEGSIIDPYSVITLPIENGLPVFPQISRDPSDPFLKKINLSGKKWVIITNNLSQPVMVIDADGFLRDALFRDKPFYPFTYCHRPIVISSPDTKLDSVISKLKVYPIHPEDDVIDMDIVIYWGHDEKRIITGSDILGRLLRGIVVRV